MNKERFWGIIDEALESSGGWEQICTPLVERLSQLDDADIVRWGQIFDLYFKLSYKDRLWAAAYVINGGCSDDGFDYFRGWLIVQGKAVFLNALRDPDSLVELDADKIGIAECEDIYYAAQSAFFKKHNLKEAYGEYLYECSAYPLTPDEKETIEAEIVYAVETDLDWSNDEELLKDIVPRLWEFYEE